ncbi:uncharacterized protein LOC107274861 [Cephus cinctus]|uniref:Uncharacterized protein LOC107274861 n=1 Tax=Cephus cinctus TaxID=211228 RepID=A0AAJ7R739_CEPCN|nr:uncharacterized protein LOC107274861 [Cephus cinctus]
MTSLAGRSVFLICFIATSTIYVNSEDTHLLSRRKRYIVFPEGSSFSIALCMTMHTLTNDNIFTEGMNWGISYDLPNETKAELAPFLELRKDRLKSDRYDKTKQYSLMAQSGSKQSGFRTGSWTEDRKYYAPPSKKYYKSDYYYVQRRHRRDLYNKLEVIMNAMGFDGRTCVLRALCEASQRLMPKGTTLVEEMMRIAFSMPLKKIFSFEPEEHHVYTKAHAAGHEGHDCVAMFPACSFSLIDMALGKYSLDKDSQDYGTDYGGKQEDIQKTSRMSDDMALRYSMK